MTVLVLHKLLQLYNWTIKLLLLGTYTCHGYVCIISIIPVCVSDQVKVMKNNVVIGKGLYLKMNSEGNILFYIKHALI